MICKGIEAMNDLHRITDLVGRIFHNIWSYELVTVSGNHIRTSNITLAVILFLMGFRYSKNFRGYITNYVKVKLNTDKDAANALEKLILYVSLCLYVVTILEIANIPLSTFAFVGGALAIGIGLGAQTLIGNFISSLIIMVEKPMKIGDIVEIEGVTGTVSSVGARCVILKTLSNVEVLVPNSKLMQNTLINWTLSDNHIKFQIEIYVYREQQNDPEQNTEFDPREFADKIYKIASQLKFISHGHNPEIYLTEINDEKFGYVLNFYCNLEEIQNPKAIKNAFNLAIYDNFKNHKIVVYYPKTVNVKPSSDHGDKGDK